MTMPRYAVYRGGFIRRDWRWRLIAANGEIVAHGEGYSSRAAAIEGVETVRRLSGVAGVTVPA